MKRDLFRQEAILGKTSKTRNGQKELLVIVPSTEVRPIVMEGASLRSAGPILDKIRDMLGKEIKIDPNKLRKQIPNYIALVREVAQAHNKSKDSKSGIRLSQITLSLAFSAGGNIGIASASAQAGPECGA